MACLPLANWLNGSVPTLDARMNLIWSFPKRLRDYALDRPGCNPLHPSEASRNQVLRIVSLYPLQSGKLDHFRMPFLHPTILVIKPLHTLQIGMGSSKTKVCNISRLIYLAIQ